MKYLLILIAILFSTGCQNYLEQKQLIEEKAKVSEEKKNLEAQNQFLRGQVEMLNAMAPACVERLIVASQQAQAQQRAAAQPKSKEPPAE
jgi:PBP1b-binding outer membrane lipoprotein LpoB